MADRGDAIALLNRTADAPAAFSESGAVYAYGGSPVARATPPRREPGAHDYRVAFRWAKEGELLVRLQCRIDAETGVIALSRVHEVATTA